MKIADNNNSKLNQSILSSTNKVLNIQQTVDRKVQNNVNIQANELNLLTEGIRKDAQTQEDTSNGVAIDISQQALEMYRQQMERSEEQEDAVLDLAKVLEIARRISNGDKVPATDEKKLMEYSFKLYQVAKSAATLHKDKKRKEYDALFEEDEKGVTREKMRELEHAEPEGMEEIALSEGIPQGNAKVVITE